MAAAMQVSQAAVINLTTAGSSGSVNGATFQQVVGGSAGSGVLDPFVRIQQKGNNTTEEGYNSSVRPVMPDVDTSPFTKDILLSSLDKVTIASIDYFKFLLDINEPNSDPAFLVTLHALQLYTKTGPLTTANTYAALTSGATLVWNLDAGSDSKIELKDLNSGSGQYDMFAYIPSSVFGTDLTKNVYLYSAFGVTQSADGGFEEWSSLKKTDGGGGGGGGGRVPDGGSTIASLGAVLLGLGSIRKLIASKA